MAAVAAFLCVSTYAQSEIAKTTFNKDQQSAVLCNFSYPEEAVNNGVGNRMSKFGKAKKVKGFLMYRSVNVSDISGSPVTLYIGVEKKDKKDNNTQLSMLIANEFDRFYTAEENPELALGTVPSEKVKPKEARKRSILLILFFLIFFLL